MAPTQTVPLPLRNALASLALEALRSTDARATVSWLLADSGTPTASVAKTLVAVGLADPPGTQILDLYAPYLSHIRAHAARVFVAARSRDAGPSAADDLEAALVGAAALWEHGLYFEVHEALEPEWAHASGDRKDALQGLIQIAVALHHWAHGNVRGARKLLADGRTRLGGARCTLPHVDTARLLEDTASWAEDLGNGTDLSARPVPALRLR